MKRSVHIALTLCAFLFTQCALSPLDQDTQRKFSPIGDDPVVVPSRPLPAIFKMSGHLETRPIWPTFLDTMFALSTCRIDTSRAHPAVWIDVTFDREGRHFPPTQVNRIVISRIRIYVDSLSLLGDKEPIVLDGNPKEHQNGAMIDVYWFNENTQIVRKRLVTGMQTKADTLWLGLTKIGLGPSGMNANNLDGHFLSTILVSASRNNTEPYPYSANITVRPK